MIELRDIIVEFPGKKVLKGLSVEVGKGECLALFGENGSGKTTLLKAVAGLTPFRGELLVAGQVIQKRDYRYKQKLGFLLKEEAFFSRDVHLTDHFSLLAALYGLPKQPYIQMASAYCERLGLEFGNRTLIRDFSDGMRQKVMLVGALAHEPDYLLLDEPFNFLDENALDTAIEILSEKIQFGIGMLLITHNSEIAIKLAHKAVLLQNGTSSSVWSVNKILPDDRFKRAGGSFLRFLKTVV